MNVLVACEESQTVTNAFRLRGHNAFSCDIQFCSGGHPEWHIQSDVTPFLSGCSDFYTCDHTRHFISSWDLLIAHPPCTYLTRASANHLFIKPGVIDPVRYNLGLEARDFFYKCLNAPFPRVCVENPVPLKIFRLPDPSQVVQPYLFGDPFSKKTYLWFKNLPPLFSTCICSDFSSWVSSHRSPKSRSKFFPGLAAAMVDQWSF